MKYSLAFVSVLVLPDVFAVALPSIPKLISRGKTRAEGELDYFKKATGHDAQELRRRDLPEHKELAPRRGSPLVVNPGPSSTPTTTGPNGYLPSDPSQSEHNAIVGGHPWAGHGPAIVSPKAGATGGSTAGQYDLNVFVVSYTGTALPIKNATATIYAPVVSATCYPMPVGEYTDSNGNFLPTNLQPGYNGSISTNGTTMHCPPPSPPPPPGPAPACYQVPVGEYEDGDGGFLPPNLQPGLNGSISTNGSTLYCPPPGTPPREMHCTPVPVGEYTDGNGNFLPPALQPGLNGSISTNGSTMDCSLYDSLPVATNKTSNCYPVPVGEYDDENGGLLPPNLQPGLNGSISTNGTTMYCPPPGSVPIEQVIIKAKAKGNNTEVVEIDFIPLPNNSTLQGFYDANRNVPDGPLDAPPDGSLLDGPLDGPFDGPAAGLPDGPPISTGDPLMMGKAPSPSTTGPPNMMGGAPPSPTTTGGPQNMMGAPPPSPTTTGPNMPMGTGGTGTRQRVPDAGNPAFVGPKV